MYDDGIVVDNASMPASCYGTTTDTVTVEILGERIPWARHNITSSEDPISMPNFEFVLGSELWVPSQL